MRQSRDDTRTARATHYAWFPGQRRAEPGPLRSRITGKEHDHDFVVTESCIRCKPPTAGLCPPDAFRGGPNFLVIDPDDCIDCTLCVSECPVYAIFAEDDVPPAQRASRRQCRASEIWNPIIAIKPACPTPRNGAKVETRWTAETLSVHHERSPALIFLCATHHAALALASLVSSLPLERGPPTLRDALGDGVVIAKI